MSFIHAEAKLMNPINLLFSVLLRNKILQTLNISSCGLNMEAGTMIAEVFSSSYVELETLSLDISNNNFGPIGIDNRKLIFQ